MEVCSLGLFNIDVRCYYSLKSCCSDVALPFSALLRHIDSLTVAGFCWHQRCLGGLWRYRMWLSCSARRKILAIVPVCSAVTLKMASNRSHSRKHPLQQTKARRGVTPDDGGSESSDNKFTCNPITALIFSTLPHCSFC